jgi:hypothetical protein
MEDAVEWHLFPSPDLNDARPEFTEEATLRFPPVLLPTGATQAILDTWSKNREVNPSESLFLCPHLQLSVCSPKELLHPVSDPSRIQKTVLSLSNWHGTRREAATGARLMVEHHIGLFCS